jgi:site-specific DNA-cytosine methylase
VDLFAGIGGFRLGLEQIGGQRILSNKLDEGGTAIYCQNVASFNNCFAIGDVVDIVTEKISDFD